MNMFYGISRACVNRFIPASYRNARATGRSVSTLMRLLLIDGKYTDWWCVIYQVAESQ